MSKTMKEIASSLAANTRTASAELRNGLQSIRQHIRRLNAQIVEVRAIPPLLETAVERMETWVEARASHARTRTTGISPFMAAESFEEPRWMSDEHVAMAYLTPLIKQCLRDELKAAYATSKGISDYDREQQLDKLGVELLDAELVEESIIRDAERAGFQLSRRGNADPRAVLAADKDLP